MRKLVLIVCRQNEFGQRQNAAADLPYQRIDNCDIPLTKIGSEMAVSPFALSSNLLYLQRKSGRESASARLGPVAIHRSNCGGSCQGKKGTARNARAPSTVNTSLLTLDLIS